MSRAAGRGAHQALADVVADRGSAGRQPVDVLRFDRAFHSTEGVETVVVRLQQDDVGAIRGFDSQWRIGQNASE